MYIMRGLFVVLIITGTLAILAEPLASAYYWIHHTELILDFIPINISQGHHMVFSGRLLTSEDKTPLPDRTIFIQYDSPYDATRTITSAKTDSNGYFMASWIAEPKGYSGGTYYIFAKFNGDDENFFSISHQYILNVFPTLPKITR